MRSLERQDLLAVVADKDAQFALEGVLVRPKALGIREINHRVSDLGLIGDSGCLLDSPEAMRSQIGLFACAVVVFDRHGCGREGLAR
jgi:hypothetical protein